MKDLHKLYKEKYPEGGVLKLYNLFNLKNQDSNEAIKQIPLYKNYPEMFTSKEEILFGNAPVVIASGRNASRNEDLIRELKKYISLANADQLYSISKEGYQRYAVIKAEPSMNTIAKCYHPSFTFKYGNTTRL